MIPQGTEHQSIGVAPLSFETGHAIPSSRERFDARQLPGGMQIAQV
jgi:hypothetical protein